MKGDFRNQRRYMAVNVTNSKDATLLFFFYSHWNFNWYLIPSSAQKASVFEILLRKKISIYMKEVWWHLSKHTDERSRVIKLNGERLVD